MNKILKFLFVILFVVLLGEMIYLFYSNSINQKRNSNANIPTNVPNIIPTINQAEKKKINYIDDWMNKFDNFVTSSVITSNGTLNKIIDVEDNKHGIKIMLNNSDSKQYGFYYNDDNINELNFYEQKAEDKVKIDKGLLKQGDKITIIETYKSLDGKPNTKIIIEVIKQLPQ